MEGGDLLPAGRNEREQLRADRPPAPDCPLGAASRRLGPTPMQGFQHPDPHRHLSVVVPSDTFP